MDSETTGGTGLASAARPGQGCAASSIANPMPDLLSMETSLRRILHRQSIRQHPPPAIPAVGACQSGWSWPAFRLVVATVMLIGALPACLPAVYSTRDALPVPAERIQHSGWLMPHP